MGERALENRIKKLRAIEEKQKELEAQAEELRKEIREDLQRKGKEEVNAGAFVVRLKEVVSNRFDSKSLKEQHKALYEAYKRPQSTFRLTIV